MNLTQTITELINSEGPKFDTRPLYIHEIKLLDNEEHKIAYKKKQCLLTTTNERLLYHGTPLRSIENIISNNFDTKKISKGGHIGAGIYFSDMVEQSIYYCLKEEYLGTEVDFIVLVCKVELGTCCELTRSGDTPNCSKLGDSHSAPYSQGDKSGHEYCLFDSDQILPVCRLHLKVS